MLGSRKLSQLCVLADAGRLALFLFFVVLIPVVALAENPPGATVFVHDPNLMPVYISQRQGSSNNGVVPLPLNGDGKIGLFLEFQNDQLTSLNFPHFDSALGEERWKRLFVGTGNPSMPLPDTPFNQVGGIVVRPNPEMSSGYPLDRFTSQESVLAKSGLYTEAMRAKQSAFVENWWRTEGAAQLSKRATFASSSALLDANLGFNPYHKPQAEREWIESEFFHLFGFFENRIAYQNSIIAEREARESFGHIPNLQDEHGNILPGVIRLLKRTNLNLDGGDINAGTLSVLPGSGNGIQAYLGTHGVRPGEDPFFIVSQLYGDKANNTREIGWAAAGLAQGFYIDLLRGAGQLYRGARNLAEALEGIGSQFHGAESALTRLSNVRANPFVSRSISMPVSNTGAANKLFDVSDNASLFSSRVLGTSANRGRYLWIPKIKSRPFLNFYVEGDTVFISGIDGMGLPGVGGDLKEALRIRYPGHYLSSKLSHRNKAALLRTAEKYFATGELDLGLIPSLGKGRYGDYRITRSDGVWNVLIEPTNVGKGQILNREAFIANLNGNKRGLLQEIDNLDFEELLAQIKKLDSVTPQQAKELLLN